MRGFCVVKQMVINFYCFYFSFDDDDLVFEDFARHRARGTELLAQNEMND